MLRQDCLFCALFWLFPMVYQVRFWPHVQSVLYRLSICSPNLVQVWVLLCDLMHAGTYRVIKMVLSHFLLDGYSRRLREDLDNLCIAFIALGHGRKLSTRKLLSSAGVTRSRTVRRGGDLISYVYL